MGITILKYATAAPRNARLITGAENGVTLVGST
jgi:hypothetical protein